jgi:hypothetical protein
MGLHTKTELIHFASEHGLVDLRPRRPGNLVVFNYGRCQNSNGANSVQGTRRYEKVSSRTPPSFPWIAR